MKIRKRRLAVFILIIVVIIVAIIFSTLNKEKEDITVNGDIDSIGSKEILNPGKSQDDNQVDNGDNTEGIHINDTVNVDKYVDETGKELTTEEMTIEKEKISNKFKSISPDILGLNVDMSEVKLMYNQGTNNIDGNICYVFSVYVPNGDTVSKIGTYAISTDLLVLYRFNSDTMKYELIK